MSQISFEPKVKTVIEDGCFKIIHGQHVYEIEAGRIISQADLLGWTHHLLGKSWMDAYSLKCFIEVVAQYRGFSVYGREGKA